MEQETKWIASWSDKAGQTKTLIFSSAQSRGVALIDFKLHLLDQGERIPERYELGEVDESPTVILPKMRGPR
jgi:hypothetical protein